MKAAPDKFDAPEQKALTTYIKHQALGKPMHVDLSEGEMQSWWEKGTEIYYTRFGQLNLACASCHEENNGRYIRSDHLSQDQGTGFQTYRLTKATTAPAHTPSRDS